MNLLRSDLVLALVLCLPALAVAQGPFVFEPDAAVPGTFVARRPAMEIRVDGGGAVLALANGRALAIRLAGSAAAAAGEGPLPGRSHYLLGADATTWRRDVPHAARVRC